jgi:V-type H+-transporting ATPase subunit E
MKSEAEDIEMLERAIMMEAREESEQMQAEAKEKADAIQKRARGQASAERMVILDRANQDAERLRRQAMATAQLKARSTQLDYREKLLADVFKAVKAQLDDVKNRPDYDTIVALLLREALTQLHVNKAEVKADETTKKSLAKGTLDEAAKEINGELSIGNTLEEGVGIVVEASNGKIHYDNTLETRLSRLQNALRSSVYKVLMGESA